MADELLSIGIDIGTSTTQVIFSRLSIENTSGYFSVPQIRIVDKQVIYKGEVHSTPPKDQDHDRRRRGSPFWWRASLNGPVSRPGTPGPAR